MKNKKIEYYCKEKDCNNKIGTTSAIYGGGRCTECNYKYLKLRTKDKYKCLDCDKHIYRYSKRCRKCSDKNRKIIKVCIDCNKQISLRATRCGLCYGKTLLGKKHKQSCKCGTCKAKRGEYKGVNSPTHGKKWKHKKDCQCMICKAVRGETKGKKHPKYGISILPSKEIREKISQTLMGHKSWNKGKKCPQLSGKNHWNWKGGITKLHHSIRNSQECLEWKKIVLKRDNYHCQECDKIKVELEVHHKIGVAEIIEEYKLKTFSDALKCKILWNTDNGVVLRIDCHNKTKKRRK